MLKKIVMLLLIALPLTTSLLEATCSGGCCGGQCGIRRNKKTATTHNPVQRNRNCQSGSCSVR